MEAKAKYRQLLAVDQKNIDFNYKYGVCIYETENKLNARRYFDFILNQTNFPIKARFYRGKIFQFEYQFDKAIREFEACRNDKLLGKEALDEIKSCISARNLIKLKSNLVVKEKFLTNKGNHEKFYQLSEPYSFYAPEKDEIYDRQNNALGFKPKYLFKRGMKYRVFASYSDKKEFGLDIFIQSKNYDGEWGEITKIPTVNTFKDENYPFLDDSTGILYFASMGHNSMGGYDIFKAAYNWKTNSIGTVENLGFPFNTPSDDYLYVTDYGLNSAFFTSNRNGDLLNTEVFNVSMTQSSTQFIASQAQWIDEVENQQVPVKLYARNIESDETFGPFVSDLSGKVGIYLPAQGNYEYVVEFSVYGQEKQFKKLVDIPLISENEIIEQTIRYFIENSFEQIEINTYVRNLEKNEDIDPLSLQEISKLLINEKSVGLASLSHQMASIDVFSKLNIQEIDNKKALEKLVDILLEKEIDMENIERFRIQSNESIQKNNQRLKELALDIENLEKEIPFENKSDDSELRSKKNQVQELLKENLVLMNLLDRQNKINEIRPNLDDITLLNSELNEFLQTKSVEEAEKFIASKLFQIQKSLDIVVISPQQIKTDIQQENSKKIENIEREINSYSFQVDSLEKQIEKFNKELNSLSKKNQEKRKIEITSLSKQLNSTLDLKSESEYQFKLLNFEREAFSENEDLISLLSDQSLKIEQIDLITAIPSYQKNKEEIIQQLIESEEKGAMLSVHSELIDLKKRYDENKIRTDLITNSQQRFIEQKKIEQEFLAELQQLGSSDNEEVIELIQLTQNRINEAVLNLDNLNKETRATSTNAPEKILEENNPIKEEINQASNAPVKILEENNPIKEEINQASNAPAKILEENNPIKEEINQASNAPAKILEENNPIKEEINQASNAPVKILEENNPINEKINQASNAPVKILEENNPIKEEINQASNAPAKILEENNPIKEEINQASNAPVKILEENNPINEEINQASNVPTQGTEQNSVIDEIPDNETSKLEKIDQSSPGLDVKTGPLVADRLELLSAIENAETRTQVSLNEKQRYTLTNAKIRTSEKIKRDEELMKIFFLDKEKSVDNYNQRVALLSVQLSKLEQDIKQEENDEIRKILMQEKAILEEERLIVSPGEEVSYDTRLNPLNGEIEAKELTILAKSTDYLAYVEERISLANSINAAALIQKKIAGTTHNFVSVISSAENDKVILEDSIKKMHRQLNEIEKKILVSSAKLSTYENQAKYESMVLQNIQPDILIGNMRNEQVLPASFNFNKKEDMTFDVPLPIAERKLSGLIFRVQVGAFRKAVPSHLFREFTPVNGEVIANGLTCYMAGYFNSSSSAMRARDDIRLLGYADAFIVAYCDGKRIPFGLGRAYEKNKQCIVLTENELGMKLEALLEKSAVPESNTLATKKNTVSTVDEYGIETDVNLNYLYFTVQVGVFNRAINPARLNGITDLLINKSLNGQLRYSSGRFDNIDDAKKRKAEVNSKGITDAFIVAYYNGKRISSSEAQKMINMNPEIVKVQSNSNNTFTTAPAVQSNFDFNLLKPTISKTKYYYVSELKIDDMWKPCDYVFPLGYNPSSQLLTSPLYERPFSSPEVIISLREFQLKEFDISGLKVMFKLSKENSGVLLNHMMRTSYTYELTNDKLIVYPPNQGLKEQLTLLKQQFEEE